MNNTDEYRELNHDIAIIGVAGKLPFAENMAQFWDNLINEVECIQEFPDERKKEIDNYVKSFLSETDECQYEKLAYLKEIDKFDPEEFHLTPKEAQLMDPHQRLLLESIWQTIQDAGYSEDEIKGKNVGVYVGKSNFEDVTYFDMLSEVEKESIDIGASGNLQSILPSRVSYFFDFKGPAMVIDTACSSSLVAVATACQAIREQQCDMAVVGSIRLHMFPLSSKYHIGFESENGRTKAFDQTSCGTGKGEGVISIMLKPKEKAIKDGDHIYGVIKGFAVNQDGRSMGITAPNSEAQSEVIVKAWEDAQINPEEVSYIETHGTGTLLGDPLEIDGITAAFRKYTQRNQFCAIGSAKNNVGHLYEVSGLVSVVKCLFSLNQHKLAPMINLEYPNGMIDFIKSPVYINSEISEWKPDNAKRICGVSSYGFSGTNCHIVLEEAERRSKSYMMPSLLFFSGKTLECLNQYVAEFLTMFEEWNQNDIRDVIYTSLVGRKHYNHRLIVFFKDARDLKEKLEYIIENDVQGCSQEGIYYHQLKSDDGSVGTNDEIYTVDLNKELNDSSRKKLIEAYLYGQKVNWKRLFQSESRLRVHIPHNVLEHKSYWLDIEHMTVKKNIDMKSESETETQIEETILLEGRDDAHYTDTEVKLARIIAKIMGFDQIDIERNFNSMGGDSILVTKLYHEIIEQLNVDMPIATLFSYPTIAGLGSYIDSISKKQTQVDEMEEVLPSDSDIAIIGMDGRFPFADNVEEYWNNIYFGRNCIRDLPENRVKDLEDYVESLGLSKESINYSKGGYLDDISQFDYRYFAMSKSEAELMDPNQRMLLMVVVSMLNQAGYGGKRLADTNTGVFIGYTEEFAYNYRRFILDSDISLAGKALAGNLSPVLAGRISYALDLRGPSMVVDTACSSSLVALSQAVENIQQGKCGMAIVGSSHLKILPIEQPEAKAGIESPSFSIKAFDDRADGTVEGEAVCALLLKPLKQAILDGDNIRAVIKGCAVNQDGASMGIMAPRTETQAQVIADAIKQTNIHPETISYIETHGTGTKLGDPIEIEALKLAFEQYTDKKQFCAISAVKPNIGHLYQAAGLASVIKAVLAMEHKIIPPMIHMDSPNRLIQFENSPFYVNDEAREWPSSDHARYCGISSFGLSGTNCHVILGEYIPTGDEQTNNEKKCEANKHAEDIFQPEKCWFRPSVKRIMVDKKETKEYKQEDVTKENIAIQESEEDREWTASLNAFALKVCDAFKQVLNVQKIRKDSNFFTCGGDSVLAIKFATELYNKTGMNVQVSDIFSYPVLENLVEYLSQSNTSSANTKPQLIEPIGEKELYELSYMQEELWLSAQINADSSALNIVETVILKNFDEELLYKALYKVVERHKVMRARFVLDDGKPMQYVERTETTMSNFTVIDLSGNADCWDNIKEKINKDAVKEFSILKDILVRMNLYKVDEHTSVFELNIHHIISDWVSMYIIMKDLLYYYKCMATDTVPELEPLDIQYFDFAVWHKQNVLGHKEELENYWNQVLVEPLPVLNLSTDFKRKAIKEQIGRRMDIKLDTDKVKMLKEYGENHYGTLYMALLSIVYILLHKNSGQDEIMIGSNTSGRDNPQLENQVGYYINMLPIRIHAHDEDSFENVFEYVKEQVIGAYAHQDYPFVQMLNHPSVRKDTSRSPIFDVVAQLIYEPIEDELFPEGENSFVTVTGDAQIAEYNYDSNESKYDLVFNFYEKSGEVTLQMDYSTGLFTENTAREIVTYFNDIVDQVTSQFNVTIADINDQKLEDLYEQYNHTEKEIEVDTLQGMFHKTVMNFPTLPAIRLDDKVLSYKELDEASDQVAGYLQERNIDAQSYVPLLTERKIESIINMLGILKTGAAYVPINIDYPKDRIDYIRKELNADFVMDSKLTQTILTCSKEDSHSVSHAVYDNYDASAYIIYTSGSTGTPKGVEIQQSAVCNTIKDINERFQVIESDKIIGLSSMSFDLSVYDIFGAFYVGAELVLVKDQRDMKMVADILVRERITVWNSVPMIADMLMEYLKSNTALYEQMEVRLFLLSGDWIPIKLPDTIHSLFGKQCEVISLGGATEGSIWSIYYPIQEVCENWTSIPYGYPLYNQTYYVLDQNRRICPIGIKGDLYIGGAGLAKGYFHDEEKTAGSFITHERYGRLYKTGDVGVMRKEGFIEFLGREDSQVKIKGYRVELAEIESSLEKIDQIKDSAVTVYLNQNGTNSLCAYLVAENGELDIDEIKNSLKKDLPEYMIPSYFMQIDHIPLTANCKLDKKSLPLPETNHTTLEEPETGLEKMMVEIWKEVLGKNEIGVNQNFFELGGDSLTALKVELAAEELGCQLNDKIAASIFKYPTIRELIKNCSGENQ